MIDGQNIWEFVGGFSLVSQEIEQACSNCSREFRNLQSTYIL